MVLLGLGCVGFGWLKSGRDRVNTAAEGLDWGGIRGVDWTGPCFAVLSILSTDYLSVPACLFPCYNCCFLLFTHLLIDRFHCSSQTTGGSALPAYYALKGSSTCLVDFTSYSIPLPESTHDEVICSTLPVHCALKSPSTCAVDVDRARPHTSRGGWGGGGVPRHDH